MERAFAWFLGVNDLGVCVVDVRRGSCCDGLTPSGVNTNEGAEFDADVAHRGGGDARHSAPEPDQTTAVAARSSVAA